jgi:hypothetical protein
MSTLLRELAAFANGDGAPIHSALKKKLPNLRFNFEKYAGDQSFEMVRQLFSSDSQDLVAILRTTASQLQDDPDAAAVGLLIERLCTFGEINQMSGDDATGVARFAGSQTDLSGGESVLDPEHIVLTPTMARGLRQAFVRAIQDDDPFDEHQRRKVEYFIEATSNVEQLMSLYFMKYMLGRPADQKAFLYIVWMLWAYLRIRSSNPRVKPNSIYEKLPEIGGEVITFNYTSFFKGRDSRHACFFHGRLSEYLQLDTRVVITNDSLLNAATSVETVIQFIEGLRLDVVDSPAIDVPSIVPPTKFKPVMSRAQLMTWARADALLQHASSVVVIGYSFAMADEHFNDLIRHSQAGLRVIVVNPDIAAVSREAARVLGISADALVDETRGAFATKRAGRLLCVAANAEDVTPQFLDMLS